MQAASAELSVCLHFFTFPYFMHICGQISCGCWSEGWDRSIGCNSICVFMVVQIQVGLHWQGRLDFHCAVSYSWTVTLPITLRYCILILSKLISLHFKRLKAQGGSLRVLSNYADTHTHHVWTRQESGFEDFLFVFQGCAPLTSLEGNVFVLTPQRSSRWKQWSWCKMNSSMKGSLMPNGKCR